MTAEMSANFLNDWNSTRDHREKIYISYDSTNKNCQAGDLEIVEYGHPKVDIGEHIFNYSIAYDTDNKEPLFYKWAKHIDEYDVYGTTIKRKLYESDEKERYFHLFHSSSKEGEERALLAKKLRKMKRNLTKRSSDLSVQMQRNRKKRKVSILYKMHKLRLLRCNIRGS